MNDKEIYQGFVKNDQRIMSQFYYQNYSKFLSYFKKGYGKSDEYVADLFHDSFEALWNNIRMGNLTEDNLSSSMYSYMLGISRNMLMARDRKNREIFKVRMFLTDPESGDEELNIAVQELLQRVAAQPENEYWLELQDFTTRAVADMKPPCDKLLRYFYWDRMCPEAIAREMGYSGEDSVKTQKFKCVQKIAQIVKEYARLLGGK